MTQNATAYFNVVEAGRSNRANELETHRKNVATEQHNANVLSETIRHNQALEQVERERLLEAGRHNREQETLGYGNLSLDWSRLSETARANRAAEAELFRSHRIQETELLRSHLVSEGIGAVEAWSSLRNSKANQRRATIESSRNKWQREAQKHSTIQGYFSSGTQVLNAFTNARNATSNRINAGASLLSSVGKLFTLFH